MVLSSINIDQKFRRAQTHTHTLTFTLTQPHTHNGHISKHAPMLVALLSMRLCCASVKYIYNIIDSLQKINNIRWAVEEMPAYSWTEISDFIAFSLQFLVPLPFWLWLAFDFFGNLWNSTCTWKINVNWTEISPKEFSWIGLKPY